jgi:hypothetical protein
MNFRNQYVRPRRGYGARSSHLTAVAINWLSKKLVVQA